MLETHMSFNTNNYIFFFPKYLNIHVKIPKSDFFFILE